MNNAQIADGDDVIAEIVPAPSPQKVSLSSADVSRMTGMSVVHVRRLMSEGLIESVMISSTRGRKYYRCSPDALARFIASRSTKSQ